MTTDPRTLAAVLLAGLATATLSADGDESIRLWPPAAREAELAYEAALNAVPSPDRLRDWHDRFCAEVHPAGTPADERMIRTLLGAFAEFGMAAERHDIWAYLARPVSATVQCLRTTPGGEVETIDLPVTEDRVAGDPYMQHDDLPIGWNAYGASGDVTAEVVYANRATKQDFERLRELGVDCTGKIVVARYGGNFRGYKAKYAEEAGAVGLLIYTDPADSGYTRGAMYPDGGYANPSSIQRGSIKALAYPGDPLTPFIESTADAPRLDPDAVALPRIPVQPVGWGAAERILDAMNGPTVPDGWAGGLPLTYRLTGGADLRVRLAVVQERATMKTANVLGTVIGATHPDEIIVVGCHFDAWSFGAGDPHAGSIVLFEMARSVQALADAGHPPARTVIFANWGAEEFGIIGSTEWCEANQDRLAAGGIAYINLDMAAMGPNFGCGAAPVLQQVIADAARAVPQAGAPEMTVFERWAADGDPRFGDLGGGSDFLGFYQFLGVPACSLGAGGSDGVSYHSNYDNLAWYRQVVGDDYESALMLARLGNIIVARLANAPVPPLDFTRYAPETRRHLDAIEAVAAGRHVALDTAPLRAVIDEFETVATDVAARMRDDGLADPAAGDLLRHLERRWLYDGAGLADRPWFRNQFAASDPTSGYAAWMLPALRAAVEDDDAAGAASVLGTYDAIFQTLRDDVRAVGATLERRP